MADPVVDSISSQSPARHVMLVMILLALITVVQRAATWTTSTRFNTDEAIYEAGAAYLISADKPTVSLNHNMVFVTMLYRWLAEWFGVYRMAPVRILVTVLAVTIVSIVGRTVARQSNAWWGLLAGIVFLGASQVYEGYICNREWFSVFWVVVSLAVAEPMLAELASAASFRRHTFVRAFLSGLLLSGAWWFKDQSLPFLFVVVAAIFWLTLAGRTLTNAALLAMAAHCLGVIMGLAGYAACFAAHGLLREHGVFVRDWIFAYAVDSSLASMIGPHLLVYVDQYIVSLPLRTMMLLAYIGVAAGLIGSLRRDKKFARSPAAIDATQCLWSMAFLAGLAAIVAGHRFFLHYYLFICPALAILGTLSLVELFRRAVLQERKPIAAIVGSLVMLAVLAFDFAFKDTEADPETRWPEALLAGVITILTIVGVFRAVDHPRRPIIAVVQLLLGAVIGLIGAQGVIAIKSSWQINENLQAYQRAAEIGAAVRQRASGPDDYLLVWGFFSDIYPHAQLMPATRFVFCAQLMNDIQPDPTFCVMRTDLGQQFWDDMAARPPRLIVDAASISHSASSNKVYQTARTPALADLLARQYRLAATVHDCPIYERITAASGR